MESDITLCGSIKSMSLNSVALLLVSYKKEASEIPDFRKEKGVAEDQAKIKEFR